MDPATAAVAAAALGYIGGERRNAASAKAAQKQMDFQREMSNTSYQRQIADLKAAGINPMLVSRLGGASTPAGSMPQFENIGASAASAYAAAQSSGASAKQADTAETLSESQVKQIDATVEKIKEETKNVPIEAERLRKTVELLFSQTVNVAQNTRSQYQVELQTMELINKVKAETSLLNNQVAVEDALDDLGRTATQFKPFIEMLRLLIRR
jgi:predicted ribosome quality control (RQC) complex YloA/Tae2 family protein